MSNTLAVKTQKNLNNHSQPHLIYLSGVIILAVICGIPFIIAAVRHSYVSGDDILTHMQRVEGMLSSIKTGHIPARLHLKTLCGYAYGMGFFYPQLLLVIPLIGRLLGLNFILTTNGFLVLINILTGLSTYFCVYRITKSKPGALCAAAASLFGYYRLADLTYRGSIGETAVFIFTPLLILGLYEIYRSQRSGLIWMVIGLSGILYTHLFSFIFSGIIILIFLLITSCKWILNKSIRSLLVISAGISLLITASFWLPFIEQYFSIDILAKTGNPVSPYRPAVPFKTTLNIISYWWRDMPSYLYDPLLAVYPVILAGIVFGEKKYRGFLVVMLLTGSAGFYLSSNLFPWDKAEKIHHLIQFSWRMMFIPSAVLPAAAGVSIGSIKNNKTQNILTALFSLLFIFSAVPVLMNVTDKYILQSPGYRGVQNDVGAGDYLPTGADIEWIKSHGKNIFFDPDKISSTPTFRYDENGLHAELQYTLSENMEAEFPFLYYKGWYCQSGNDKPQAAEKGPHGLILCDIHAADENNVKVYYQKTPLQWLADFLSCVGLAVLSGVILHERKNRL